MGILLHKWSRRKNSGQEMSVLVPNTLSGWEVTENIKLKNSMF